MLKQLKTFTLRMVAGANLVTVLIMLVVGLADHINPINHPILSCIGLIFPVFLILNFCFLVFFLLFKRRYALIPIVGFIICYFPIRTYCPLNFAKKAPEDCIKVLSYNVYSFASDGAPKDHPNPILDYILESGADIVCLQEAWLDSDIDTKAKAFYNYRDSVLNFQSGLCIVMFSKFPILSKQRIMYPSKGNMSAAFSLKIDADTVMVVVNHFETTGLSLEDRAVFKEIVKGKSETDTIRAESKRVMVKLGESSKIRAPQADAVADFVSKWGKSVILCGDFNDSPISYTHRRLAKELTDCYVAVGLGPGISYHGNAMYVRIDNIMCSKDWTPYECKVDRSIGYSDHYPIYCLLEKRKN